MEAAVSIRRGRPDPWHACTHLIVLLPMSSRKSDSASPVRWVRDLLKRPVKFELRGAQVHVVLGETDDRHGASTSGSSAGEALRRGHAELRELLRGHPDARPLMRHLGFVEQTIARFGSRALKSEIPVPVLRKAVDQLDLLVRGSPTEGLVYLRARLAQAAESRAPAAFEADEDTETRPGSLEVTEASHSLFDEMERSWTGQMPLDSPPAATRG